MANPKEMNTTGDDPVLSHDPFYHYYPARFTHPGTGNFVFLARQNNPVHNVLGDATVIYGHTPNPIQPPPITALGAQTTSGLGGLQHGQIISGPLYNMNASNDDTGTV